MRCRHGDGRAKVRESGMGLSNAALAHEPDGGILSARREHGEPVVM